MSFVISDFSKRGFAAKVEKEKSNKKSNKKCLIGKGKCDSKLLILKFSSE